ncbi:hypothetical protein [Streptomyces sp. NBC_01462]|uniref:hypothetical protein n=1 Tax=Streptomyces sp. NBC_01462 TaxID=2903876 RepID=UPI002E31F108|nr:hypothetical protein [Streptomyces sp. NBC_01462]
MPDGSPFFVIGQRSGPDLTLRQVQAAPEKPEEPDDACEEIRRDSRDEDGSVEIAYAASVGEAARREAAETAEQISQDLKRQRERRTTAARRARRKVQYRRT